MENNDFYKEICATREIQDEKDVCAKYDKDHKETRAAINQAMRIHMMSTSNDRGLLDEMIIAQLKKKGL